MRCLLFHLESCSQVYEQEEKQIVSLCVVNALLLAECLHDTNLRRRLRATLLQIRWDLISIRITVDHLKPQMLAFCWPAVTSVAPAAFTHLASSFCSMYCKARLIWLMLARFVKYLVIQRLQSSINSRA